MSRRFWTTRELGLIRQHYPQGGLDAVMPLLPGRTRGATYQQARMMGLKAPGAITVRQSWPKDARVDDEIRAAHQRPMKKGDVVRLARSLGRPLWWVSKRARALNLVTPRFREPPWNDDELALLRTTAAATPERAQVVFRRHGFQRSATAITVQRKRNGILRQPGEDYTGHGVAAMLGHDPTTVGRWIRLGLLKAKPDPHCHARRDGRATQYVVTERALREFLINHAIRVDLRKIPAAHTPWFIELLAGRAGAPTQESAS